MSQSPDLTPVMDEVRQFPKHFQSLNLATCNRECEPEASYAPFVELDGNYYIYVSDLSAHTGNLAQNKRCSILFIESEAEAKHLFARKRLSMNCLAAELPRETLEFNQMMDRFIQKFGDFFGMLRNMSDFHLYRLSPETGNFVAGFAQAYRLEGEGLSVIKHRGDQGHGNNSGHGNGHRPVAAPASATAEVETVNL